MKTAISSLPTLLFVISPLLAQIHDMNGNPISMPSAGVDTPGLLLGQVNHPISANRHSDIDSYGHFLLAISSYDSQPLIYVIDWFSGTQVSTIPIDTTDDFGVCYDSYRGRYVTTRIVTTASDLIKIFDGANPTPLMTFVSPVPSPVGIAYDGLRDLYWICCWQNDSLNAVNPTTGTLVTSFSTAAVGCTRPAGLGYDPVHDELLVGGRNQSRLFAIAASSGALVTSFAVGSGTNEPQGAAAFSSGASAWTSSWNSSTLYEYDHGHALELAMNFSLPGTVSVTINNIPPLADCRFFFDVLPAPYVASGPFRGADISLSQVLFTLGWPVNVGPFSTYGPHTSVTYGPYPMPMGLHLNGAVVNIVNGNLDPPLRAAGGTVL